MEGAGGNAGLFIAGSPPADVAGFHQFFFDLHQILFGEGNVQSRADRLQMPDLAFRFFELSGDSFKGPFQFSVFVKIALGIFLGRESRVQGYGDGLSGVVIYGFQSPGSFFQLVSVGVQKFAVNLIFIPFFRIPQLADLEIVFFPAALQGCLYNPAEIRRLLADAGDHVFGGIIGFQKGGNAVKRPGFQSFIYGQGQRGKFRRRPVLVPDPGGEASGADILKQAHELMAQHGAIRFRKGFCRASRFQAAPVAELLRHHRGKAGQGSVQGFAKGQGLCGDDSRHFFGRGL